MSSRNCPEIDARRLFLRFFDVFVHIADALELLGLFIGHTGQTASRRILQIGGGAAALTGAALTGAALLAGAM